MATSTYLSNSVVEIGATSATTADITDQVTAVTVNFVVEALEDTTFGQTARSSGPGLQNNSASITLYASYAASESYAILSALVGTKCFLRVKPTSAALSATNPGFELSGTYLSALPVVNSNLGELAVYEIELIQGAYTADITP